MKHKNSTPRTLLPRLMMALAASVVSIGVGAAEPRQFKLMVGIVVEGLENQWLETLSDRMGEGGFRKLTDQGVTIDNIDYGTSLDGAAAASLLMTGAAPAINGIASAELYDPATERISSIFADQNVLGNFSTRGFSPSGLHTSTLSDEVRIASGGLSGVYGLATRPELAIPLAGHAGNLALWINPSNGQWASSTFYREIPTAIAARNRALPLETRMDTMSWTPITGSSPMPALPEHLTRYPFRYVFPRGTGRLEQFMATPLANREITRLAQEVMQVVHLGSSQDGTDVLNIAYSLEPFEYGQNSDNRAELIDAYLRLDKDLEQLFSSIDSSVGLDNTLIYLAGTPPRPRTRRDDEKYNIPGGEFSARRAISLLNLYLIALHGNGDYVDGFHNGYIYLNRRLIKERGLDGAQLRSQAADFLTRMTGVAEAFTIDRIINGEAGDNAAALRRNTDLATAGDVLLRIAPGYEITETGRQSRGPVLRQVERLSATTAPAFIFAPGVTAQRISTPVDARSIAPTVSRLLRIRSPNGAALPPVTLQK